MTAENERLLQEFSALGMNGGDFAGYAAHAILDLIPHRESVYADLLRSAFARGDREAVERFARDWYAAGYVHLRKSAAVSRFVPGEHYYALDDKFDSLEAAKRHLCVNGYEYAGLQEKHIYRED